MFKSEYSAFWRQSLVAVIANIVSFNVGISLGWTSPNNPKLQDLSMKDTPLDRIPTNEEISWIGGLVPLGAAICLCHMFLTEIYNNFVNNFKCCPLITAPFLAAPLARNFGPKKVILCTALLYAASYLILGFGKSLGLIYAARILQGFGVGFNSFVVPIYIGEIAQDIYRGAFGTFFVLFFVTGILIAFSIAPYVPYVTFQFICIVIPVTFGVLFVFMPESPFYTLMKGDTERTIKSLKFLRGASDEHIMKELQEIKKFIETNADQTASWSDLFTNKGNLKALLICTGLMWIQQFSGVNAVVFYAQTIFEKAGGSIKPEISSIIISAIEVVANCFTTLVIERFGRKLILIVSNVGMTIAMGLLGLYFYADTVSIASFLPITSLIVFIFIFSVGFGPIPWVLTGEMFPTNVKNSAAMIVSSACWTFAFIVTKFFDSLETAIGTHWAFWFFTICLLIGVVFTYFYVIETKGLSLQQIQDKLNGKKVILE